MFVDNQKYPLSYLIIALACLIFSMESSAQWFESQGQAYIINDDKEAARTKAMEDALKKAMLVAGASVSSVQQVVNGLLTQNELSIRASGTVNSIEILDERYTDNMVSINIRADIFPKDNQCFAADLKKSILITQSKLIHREQANIGRIYDIDKTVANSLHGKLAKNSRFLKTKTAIRNKTEFSRLNDSLNAQAIKNLVIELGHITESQYILFSEITDVSFDGEVLNKFEFWQKDIFNRNIAFSLFIYNSVNGEQIFEKNYRNLAPWAFDSRDNIDVFGDRFWSSNYGKTIDHMLDDAVTDIDESVMCKQTRAKVIQVSGNEIMINIGKQHDVQIGDEFTLLHLNNFKNDRGVMYSSFNISPYKVRVSEVTEQTALAVTPNKSLLGNIQIDDLAIRQ